jgi:hypothetical protein
MILEIDKKERETFEEACALFVVEPTFYTMENNPLMLRVEVLDGGKEISLFTSYAIGRATGMKKGVNVY